MAENATSGLVDRVKAIIVDPASEWPQIADEPAGIGEVLIKYALPLALIGPVAAFIGGQLFGYGVFGFAFRLSLMASLVTLAKSYVMMIVGLFILAAIANILAPTFGGQADSTRAFKLVAYSGTPGWMVGIFGLVPMLAPLSLLGLYGLYLFFVGATPMLKVPQAKAPSFTAVVFVAAIVFYIIASSVEALFR